MPVLLVLNIFGVHLVDEHGADRFFTEKLVFDLATQPFNILMGIRMVGTRKLSTSDSPTASARKKL